MPSHDIWWFWKKCVSTGRSVIYNAWLQVWRRDTCFDLNRPTSYTGMFRDGWKFSDSCDQYNLKSLQYAVVFSGVFRFIAKTEEITFAACPVSTLADLLSSSLDANHPTSCRCLGSKTENCHQVLHNYKVWVKTHKVHQLEVAELYFQIQIQA